MSRVARTAVGAAAVSLQRPNRAPRRLSLEDGRTGARAGIRRSDRHAGVLADAAGAIAGADMAGTALTRVPGRHPALRFERTAFDGEIAFEDRAVEHVWPSEVIEHVTDTARRLSKLRRVLVQRGHLPLITPSCGPVRLARNAIEALAPVLGDHLHLSPRRSLTGLLRDGTFKPVAMRTAGGLRPLRRLLLACAQR